MDPIDTASVPPTPPAGVSQEDKTLAMLTHLSGIILSFIVPLIIWLTNKDKVDKGFLNGHAKEALNFQITLLIIYVVGTILTVILIGALINLVAWLACIILSILAALKANEGASYRYPFALRLIK